jgi:hypothetical protein
MAGFRAWYYLRTIYLSDQYPYKNASCAFGISEPNDTPRPFAAPVNTAKLAYRSLSLSEAREGSHKRWSHQTLYVV